MNNRTLDALELELNNPDHPYKVKLASEGASGTYFILDDDKHLAVFKDASEDPLCPNNPRTISQMKRMVYPIITSFGLYTSCLDSVAGQSFANDAVSRFIFSTLDTQVGFDKILVPDTKVVENIYLNHNKKEKGVLIDWIDNAISLYDFTSYFGRLDYPPSYISLEAFEQMAVVDYITGNMDRKAGNILVQPDVDKLYLIDNSWAFSPIQGEILGNQYAWGHFPALAQKHFSESTRNKIELIYQRRYELTQLVLKKFEELKAPNQTLELNFQRAMCFLHRIEMIHHLICVKDETFAKLSETRFADQFLQLHNAGELQLSPFIAAEDDEIGNEVYAGIKLLPAAKHYSMLYGKWENSTALQDKLYSEVKRLNEKQEARSWTGLFRNINYSDKVTVTNEVYTEIANQEDKDAVIRSELKDKSSELYKALNTHTSFFSPVFQKNIDGTAKDTTAIKNLKF